MLSIELTGLLGLLFTIVAVGMVATRLGRRSAPQAGTSARRIKSA
jgi:hypothetical protein